MFLVAVILDSTYIEDMINFFCHISISVYSEINEKREFPPQKNQTTVRNESAFWQWMLTGRGP